MSQIQVKNYKLSIVNKIMKDEKGTIPAVVDISTNGNTKVHFEKTDSNNTTITIYLCLSLTKLSFTRKIYEPGHIVADIQITLPGKDQSKLTFSDLHNIFLRKEVTLLLNVNTAKDPYTLAENYYIHEISPRYERNGQATSIYLGLSIYSMDNLMRLDKYCDAFLGSRLCNDILAFGATEFKLGTDYTNAQDPVPVQVQVDTLQHLNYVDDKDYTMEYLQPYLVQYNETFYDFVARTTNRCGEFMYFEKGKLHVGLEDTKLKKDNAKDIKNYIRLTYKSISEGPLDIELYTHDSRKNEGPWQRPNTEDKDRFNVTPWEEATSVDNNKNDNPYPKGAVYNAEVTSDEFYMPLYRNQFSKGAVDELYKDENSGKQLVASLGTVLSQASLLDMALTLTYDHVNSIIQAECSGDKLNDNGNEVIDKYAAIDPKTGRPEKEAKVTIPFCNTKPQPIDLKDPNDTTKTIKCDQINGIAGTTLKYYKDIRSNQEKQQRQMVYVEMGTDYMDLRLGDVVKFLDNNKYVIVQIDMLPDQTMTFNAIPAAKEGSDTNVSYKYYPPILSSAPFRLSEPQHAIITDSNDPNQQGCVRIRYPWQMDTKTKKEKLKDRKVSLEKKKTDLEKNLDTEFETIINNIKGINNDLGGYFENKEKQTRLVERLEDNDTTYIKEHYDIFTNLLKPLEVTADEKTNNTLSEEERNIIIEKLKDGISDLDTKINEIYENLSKEDQDKYKNIRDNVLPPKKAEITKINKEIFFLVFNEKMADAATPWIRMTTPMATQGGGMFFKPEKGDEVLVNFENGNVERPYVVGTLYTKHVLPPNAGRIIKSPNGHYIKMDDPTDGHKFLSGMVPGIKFLQNYNLFGSEYLKNVKSSEGNFDKHLLGGITMTDAYGFYKIAMSSHDRKISISSPLGDVKIDAFTGITISAPNGNVKIVGKNVDISANNRLTITSGKNIKKDFLWGFNPKDIGKMAASTMFKAVENFIDISFIRALLEVVLRPVNGTLQIKSNSFLLLEAGAGTAEVPSTAYRERYLARKNMAAFNNGYQALNYIFGAIEIANFSERARQIAKLYNTAAEKLAALTTTTDTNGNALQHTQTIFDAQFITNKDKDAFVKDCLEKEKLKELGLQWHGELEKTKGKDVEAAFDALRALKKYCEETATVFKKGSARMQLDLYDFIDRTFKSALSQRLITRLDWVQKLNALNLANPGYDYSTFVSENPATHVFNGNLVDYEHNDDYNEGVKKFKRGFIFLLLGDGITDPISKLSFFKNKHIAVTITAFKEVAINDFGGSNDEPLEIEEVIKNDGAAGPGTTWADYINSLSITDTTPEASKKKQFLSSLGQTLNENARDKLTLFDDFLVWNAATKGRILMSDGAETVSIKPSTGQGASPSLEGFANTVFSTNNEQNTKHFKDLIIKIVG